MKIYEISFFIRILRLTLYTFIMMKNLILFLILLPAITQFSLAQIDDTTFQDVEEVTVFSENEASIIFEDKRFYIVDFSLSEDRTLMLMRNMRNYFIYQLDDELKFVDKIKIDGDADALYDDCFGNTHLVTKDSVYLILDDDKGIFLSDRNPRTKFMETMEKCVGVTSEKIIFEHLSNMNQFQVFHTVDMQNGEETVIYEVNDTAQAKSLLEEGILLRKELCEAPNIIMESTTNGGSGEAAHKMQRELNARRERMSFFKSHLIRSQYNPMFVVDDTLYFFNYANNRLDRMDQHGNLIDSHTISHHKREGWENKVYSDIVDNRFYGVRAIDGILHLNRLLEPTFEEGFSSRLSHHAYPKKVIVRDGYAYYTYKPNFDANLNKLYRQKL